MDPASEELLAAAQAAVEAIQLIKVAFGAPGDFGYEKPEGKALFALYKARASLRMALTTEAAKAEGRS